MRVLHVVSALTPDGAGQQVRLLLRALPDDAEVVSLSDPGPAGAALRAEGTTVHELRSRGDRDPRAVAGLRRLIRSGRFDVVHTHLFRACVLGRLAARLAGVRAVVATAHHLGPGHIEDRPATTGHRTLYLAGERLGRATIAVTPAAAGRLRTWGVPEDRIVSVPQAVDGAGLRFDPDLRTTARAGLGLAPHVPVIGGLGRLEPGKRFDLLVRAVRTVPGAVLLLVGTGPARAALERLAVIEEVAERVLFAEAVADVRPMLCAMDVFVSPAGPPRSGLVVLEALAAGLPTLYAACPPLEDLATARNAVAGAHRLSPHDPESLPRALRTELLSLAGRGGARLPARSAGARHDVTSVAAAVAAVYERVAGR